MRSPTGQQLLDSPTPWVTSPNAHKHASGCAGCIELPSASGSDAQHVTHSPAYIAHHWHAGILFIKNNMQPMKMRESIAGLAFDAGSAKDNIARPRGCSLTPYHPPRRVSRGATFPAADCLKGGNTRNHSQNRCFKRCMTPATNRVTSETRTQTTSTYSCSNTHNGRTTSMTMLFSSSHARSCDDNAADRSRQSLAVPTILMPQEHTLRAYMFV